VLGLVYHEHVGRYACVQMLNIFTQVYSTQIATLNRNPRATLNWNPMVTFLHLKLETSDTKNTLNLPKIRRMLWNYRQSLLISENSSI
jgi:hypothetical protein